MRQRGQNHACPTRFLRGGKSWNRAQSRRWIICQTSQLGKVGPRAGWSDGRSQAQARDFTCLPSKHQLDWPEWNSRCFAVDRVDCL